MSGRARTVTVLTHARPAQTAAALARADRGGRAMRASTLRFDAEETRKHGLEAGATGSCSTRRSATTSSSAWSLGGDGTILRALRRYAGTSVPVFAVNYGEVGFLATSTPTRTATCRGLRARAGRRLRGADAARARAGDARRARRRRSTTSRSTAAPGERVAELAYAIDGEEAGSVRCDGLVLATPAGSTGYNLANGGPVLAWGVEGFVVSFIAPHSLTARALVVAPERPADGPQPLAGRGRHLARRAARRGCSAPATRSPLRSCARRRTSRRSPASSFYRRLREKFGRLATLSIIVIAGGHGQIALRLARLLSARGDTVRSLIRNPDHEADVQARAPSRCWPTWRRGDDRPRLVLGADAVVFAAGAGPGSGAERKRRSTGRAR